MAKTLIISDANILIDIEAAGLVEAVFELDITLAVPDILFYEEIGPYNAVLRKSDLRLFAFDEKANSLLIQKIHHYRNTALSRNDILAMVLALIEGCTLLTSETLLRTTAENEGLEVHGMLWLMDKLFDNCLIDSKQAARAYEKMKQDGSWLPWDEIDNQLKRFRK